MRNYSLCYETFREDQQILQVNITCKGDMTSYFIYSHMLTIHLLPSRSISPNSFMVKAVASKLPMDPTDAVGSLGSGAVLAVSPVSVRSRADEACDRDRTWLGAALPPLASSEPSLPVKKMGKRWKKDFVFFIRKI